MFFTYRQNNSYGYFVENENVAKWVVVEADDYKGANHKAWAVGLYFDGRGDCNHCGNRWSDFHSWEKNAAKETPTVYGYNLLTDGIKVEGVNVHDYNCVVHYEDGRKEYFMLSQADE